MSQASQLVAFHAGISPAALSLVLLALALSLVGGSGLRRPDSLQPPQPSVRSRPSLPLQRLQLAGGLAVGLGVFSLSGDVRGVLLGVMAGAGVMPLVGWLHRRSASDEQLVDGSTPLTLDLLAAALRSGQPISFALAVVAQLAEPRLGRQLERTAGLLQLGSDPVSAWRHLAEDPTLTEIARTASRSADSGIRLADGFEQLAGQMRAARRATAEVRAARAGAWVIAPLGLCFLPAFVCLGIIPIVVGVARDVFAGISG